VYSKSHPKPPPLNQKETLMDVTLKKEGEHRTFVLVFQPGEEVIKTLGEFAQQEEIETASFNAIGGFEGFTLGFYNLETGGFDEIPFHEDQVEVLSLSGEITRVNDVPNVHGHTVLGRRDGTTRGGHLLSGITRPILIVNVEELAHHHGHSHH
jgi:predicted DNA-binding protein with PD1-like motif